MRIPYLVFLAFLLQCSTCGHDFCYLQGSLRVHQAPGDNCQGQLQAEPFTGTKPFTYEWFKSDGKVFATTDTVGNLCSDKYYINIFDSTGCVYIDSVEI